MTATVVSADPTQVIVPEDVTRWPRAKRIDWCSEYLQDRQRGRTDMMWLAREVLQYRDVEDEVHGPTVESLQKFNGREEYMDPDTFQIVYSEPMCAIHAKENPDCTPACIGRSIWYLEGPRFRMLLDPRGCLKTTLNTISHSLQWIVNFEDIRIALSVATAMQGGDIITEVENHFRYNETFRFLYPEFCPRDPDWGSKESFTVPNRRRKWLKEPTMRVVSIGKVVAGPHYDVLKHSDLVDKENVKTPAGIKEVKDHFKYTMPLLERGPSIAGRDLTRGWVDLEGTIYDNSDLYCDELRKDELRSKSGQPCRWAVFRRDSVQEPVDDLTMWRRPFKTLWPRRYPWEELRAIYEDIGEYMFNCQYRLQPRSKHMQLAQANEIGYFPARFIKQLLPKLYVKVTIDLAGMEEESDGCNNAVVTVGHNRDGRKYVLESMVGRPQPLELINYLFELDLRYRKPVFEIERAHHAQGLLPFIYNQMEVKQQYLNMVAIPRDSNIAKDNRIFYTLQPLFKRRMIWFADNIKCLPHIVNEITNFPKYKFKDWLDAMADQMQTKDGKLDLMTAIPLPKEREEDPYKLQGGFRGFDPATKAPIWDEASPDYVAIYGDSPEAHSEHMTGVI